MCKQLPTACTIHMNREALAARTPQCTTRINAYKQACIRLIAEILWYNFEGTTYDTRYIIPTNAKYKATLARSRVIGCAFKIVPQYLSDESDTRLFICADCDSMVHCFLLSTYNSLPGGGVTKITDIIYLWYTARHH